MGGISSGWFGRRTARLTTADLRSISIRQIAQRTVMVPGCATRVTWMKAGRGVGNATVVIGPDLVIVDGEPVRLRWVQWRPDARYPMLVCPACARRCLILYLRGSLACSTCLNLAWPVERESPRKRAVRRARRTLMLLIGGLGARHRRVITEKEMYAAGKVLSEDEQRAPADLARMEALVARVRRC